MEREYRKLERQVRGAASSAQSVGSQPQDETPPIFFQFLETVIQQILTGEVLEAVRQPTPPSEKHKRDVQRLDMKIRAKLMPAYALLENGSGTPTTCERCKGKSWATIFEHSRTRQTISAAQPVRKVRYTKWEVALRIWDEDPRVLDWNHLSPKLKSDPFIARMAMRAERWDPLSGSQSCCLFETIMWSDLPPSIRFDPGVIKTALYHDKMKRSDLPDELAHVVLDMGFISADDYTIQQDRSYLRGRIERSEIKWQSLPAFRDDITFARSISSFCNLDTVEEIFQQFPELCQDQNFWINLLSNFYDEDSLSSGTLTEFLDSFAPAEILSDSVIMKMVIDHEDVGEIGGLDECFALVDHSLKSRRDFIEPLLDLDPTLLEGLSRENMENFPGLVKETLPNYANEATNFDVQYIYGFAEKVPPSLWLDRSFVLAWFGSGLPFVTVHEDGTSFFPEAWKNDKLIFLLLASQHQDSFEHAAPALRGDKDFMLQVVERDPSFLLFAPAHLQQDFDLVLRAFSGERIDLVVRYFYMEATYEGRWEFFQYFRSEMRSMLRIYDAFPGTVGNLIESLLADPTSTMSIVNQDTDTSAGFIKVLDDFLFPSAQQVVMIGSMFFNINIIGGWDALV